VVTIGDSLALGVRDDDGDDGDDDESVFGLTVGSPATFCCLVSCSMSYISNAIWQRACQSSDVSIDFDASSCW